MQDMDKKHYLVQSTNSQYSVKILRSECSERPHCIPQCIQRECSYLCRHMITCTCYDYQHGHLCKHVHKVHQVYGEMRNNATATDVSEQTEANFGVAPSKVTRNEAGSYSSIIT